MAGTGRKTRRGPTRAECPRCGLRIERFKNGTLRAHRCEPRPGSIWPIWLPPSGESR